MMLNIQCRSCIHREVCVYKEHYKDAVELYEMVKRECGKYPYFICDIRCIKHFNSTRFSDFSNEELDDIEEAFSAASLEYLLDQVRLERRYREGEDEELTW